MGHAHNNGTGVIADTGYYPNNGTSSGKNLQNAMEIGLIL